MQLWKILILTIFGGLLFLAPPKNIDTKTSIEDIPLQSPNTENFAPALKYQSVATLCRVNFSITADENCFFPNLVSRFLSLSLKTPINIASPNILYIGYHYILTNFLIKSIIYPFHFYW